MHPDITVPLLSVLTSLLFTHWSCLTSSQSWPWPDLRADWEWHVKWARHDFISLCFILYSSITEALESIRLYQMVQKKKISKAGEKHIKLHTNIWVIVPQNPCLTFRMYWNVCPVLVLCCSCLHASLWEQFSLFLISITQTWHFLWEILLTTHGFSCGIQLLVLSFPKSRGFIYSRVIKGRRVINSLWLHLACQVL